MSSVRGSGRPRSRLQLLTPPPLSSSIHGIRFLSICWIAASGGETKRSFPENVFLCATVFCRVYTAVLSGAEGKKTTSAFLVVALLVRVFEVASLPSIFGSSLKRHSDFVFASGRLFC